MGRAKQAVLYRDIQKAIQQDIVLDMEQDSLKNPREQAEVHDRNKGIKRQIGKILLDKALSDTGR